MVNVTDNQKHWINALSIDQARQNLNSMLVIAKELKNTENLSISKKQLLDKYNTFVIALVKCIDTYSEHEAYEKFHTKSYKKVKEVKTSVKKSSKYIKNIIDYRNRISAHTNLKADPVETNNELFLKNAKKAYHEVINTCASVLPKDLNIMLFPYDSVILRQTNRIWGDDELEINKRKYGQYNTGYKINSTKTLFNSPDQIGDALKHPESYYVDIDNGLTQEEGLQNRLTSSIYYNILYDSNLMFHVNEQAVKYINWMKTNGILDQFEIVNENCSVDLILKFIDMIVLSEIKDFNKRYKGFLNCPTDLMSYINTEAYLKPTVISFLMEKLSVN